jgi:hypothetical protein
MAKIPTVNMEDIEGYSEHTEHLFCTDMTCPCHESKYLIEELAEQVDEGLASTDDANRIYRGKVV